MSSFTTTRIERNRAALVALNKLGDRLASDLVPSLSGDTLKAIVECAKNIILQRVRLSGEQLAWMRDRERDLRTLISKSTTNATRVRILQQGGFLGKLLAPIIGGIVSLFSPGKR